MKLKNIFLHPAAFAVYGAIATILGYFTGKKGKTVWTNRKTMMAKAAPAATNAQPAAA